MPGGQDTPDAIGRCVVDGRWALFGVVEVAPERRRQGLATAVMTALRLPGRVSSRMRGE